MYYAYETNLIFEMSDEEKNLIATDLMCEYMNGRYLIYDDKVLYYSVEADGMHKIMAYDEKTGMIKRFIRNHIKILLLKILSHRITCICLENIVII